MMNFDLSQEYGEISPTEKVWYLLSESGYWGPCTNQDVLRLISQFKVNQSSKIWSQTLEKWQDIGSLPFFQSALEEAAKQEKVSPPTEDFEKPPEWRSSDEFWQQIGAPQKERVEGMTSRFLFSESKLESGSESKSKSESVLMRVHTCFRNLWSPKNLRFVFLLGVPLFVMVGGLLQSYWSASLVPRNFQELSRPESREISSVLKESARLSDPSVAIGLIRKEGQGPAFLLGSNQADGARFKMTIEGVSETLVGTFRFLSQATLVLDNGVARSQVLVRENGKPLFVGEYKVTVTCESCGVVGTLAEKNYFLGGTKNLAYDLELRKYHEELRRQARGEIAEMKQLAETLERELLEANTQFETQFDRTKKTEWKSFAQKWEAMHSQLGQVINRWEQLNLRGDVFYSALFSLLKQTFDLIERSQKMQNKFVEMMQSKVSDLEELANRISSESSTAQSSLLMLRSKIRTVESLPLSANGMPRTE